MITIKTTLQQARIIRVDYTQYIGMKDNEPVTLRVSGRFQYQAFDKQDYPAVGDLVWYHEIDTHEGIIERIEERKTVLKRLSQTQIHDAQIIATNIDIAFLCMSCNQDFNRTKLENLLTMSYQEGITQVIVLTKSDLTDDPREYVRQVQDITDVEVGVISVFDVSSVQWLQQRIGTNTCVFIGASGVGKSSLINALMGESHFDTSDIRTSDAQGRHTTTHRELITLPSGGTIIDTPGMRILDSYLTENLDSYFTDIAGYSKNCRYRDCTHTVEPDCEVLRAIDEGELHPERLEQYHRAERVNTYVKQREEQKQRIQEKRQQRR